MCEMWDDGFVGTLVELMNLLSWLEVYCRRECGLEQSIDFRGSLGL